MLTQHGSSEITQHRAKLVSNLKCRIFEFRLYGETTVIVRDSRVFAIANSK